MHVQTHVIPPSAAMVSVGGLVNVGGPSKEEMASKGKPVMGQEPSMEQSIGTSSMSKEVEEALSNLEDLGSWIWDQFCYYGDLDELISVPLASQHVNTLVYNAVASLAQDTKPPSTPEDLVKLIKQAIINTHN